MQEQISKGNDLIVDDERTSNTVPALKQGILDNLFYVVGKRAEVATDRDHFMALAYTVRDRILARWLTTKEDYAKHNVRTIYYLSAEYLMGPHLANNLLNLGIEDVIRQATGELDLDLNRLIERESEPGLGNGGLGRLAACYLDSLATTAVPSMGYGIRYEFGMFHQQIHDGWQVELTDYWLRFDAWDTSKARSPFTDSDQPPQRFSTNKAGTAMRSSDSSRTQNATPCVLHTTTQNIYRSVAK